MKSVENLHRVAIPLGKYAGSLNIIKFKNFKTLKSLNNKFAAQNIPFFHFNTIKVILSNEVLTDLEFKC